MCLSPIPLSPRFEFGCTGPGPPQKKIYEPFTIGIATLAATLHHPGGRFSALAPGGCARRRPCAPAASCYGRCPAAMRAAVITFVMTAPLLAPTAGP